MNSIERLARQVEMQLARLLAKRLATPVVLVSTLSVAAFGAAVSTHPQVSQVSPVVAPATGLILDSPHTFCRSAHDGWGYTTCHILASQVSTIANLGCQRDPDGDGTFICVYAADPTASN